MSISGIEKVSGICFLYLICSTSLCLINFDGHASLLDSVQFRFIIGSGYGCCLTSMLLYDCNSLSIAKFRLINHSALYRFDHVILTLLSQFVQESMARTLVYSLYKPKALG